MLLLTVPDLTAAERAHDKPVAPSLTAEPFRDGDRWCAIGDSITHSGLWHKFVYLFYATRYPERAITFSNNGIAGDTATGAVSRFSWDIQPNAPTTATIMFGMNDVGRPFYNKAKPGTPADHANRATLYRDNLKSLGESLQQSGVRLIFVSPTIYDETAVIPGESSPTLEGVNQGLAKYAEMMKSIADELGAPFLDLHTPMDRLNAERQKQDPTFSLITKDRIHPTEAGAFVMAYLFLKGQNVEPCVASMHLQVHHDKTGEVVASRRCRIQDLIVKTDGIEFVAKADALPFPEPDAAVDDVVPFRKELNQEILKVSGLAPGTYRISIDDQPMGKERTAQELAAGIDLTEETQSPQYLQSLAVRELNDQRHEIISKKLRAVAMVRMMKEKASLTEEQLKERASGKGWVANQFRVYLQERDNEAANRAEIEALVQKIRETAKPIPHRFRIQRVVSE